MGITAQKSSKIQGLDDKAKKAFEAEVRYYARKYWLNYLKESGILLSKEALLELIGKLPLISVLYSAVSNKKTDMTAEAQVNFIVNTIKSEIDAISKALNMPRMLAQVSTLIEGKGLSAANTAYKNTSGKLVGAMPVLHTLSIFTAVLSIIVSCYELKKSINEKNSLVELKSCINKSMDEFLKNTIIVDDKDILHSLYKGTEILDINNKTKRGDAKNIIKKYFGKYEDLGVKNLAQLIGKLNPDSKTDMPYIKAAQNAMVIMLNKIDIPERDKAAKMASEVIAHSALERAQRKINQATTEQDIVIVLKSLGLILAVAGLVAACMVTAGVLPVAAGFVLAGIGIILAVAMKLSNSDIDKNKAEGAYKIYSKPMRFYKVDDSHEIIASESQTTAPGFSK